LGVDPAIWRCLPPMYQCRMTDFSCWFCDRQIERADPHALLIHVRSLWRWHDSPSSDDGPAQDVYAHSGCAKEHLRGAVMTLEPSVFGEDD